MLSAVQPFEGITLVWKSQI